MSGRVLGVELGSTWLRLCLADENGRVLRRLKRPGLPWPECPAALDRALAALGRPKLDRLVLGGKGLWFASERRVLKRLLRGKAGALKIMSDLELAHIAALRGGPGVLLIGGSGSAALGRDARGRLRRAGGWGPLIGDEGSGFWIGKEALKDARLSKLWPADKPLRVGRGGNPVRETAKLAKTVLARAARGDAAARALRARAARELAKLALEASRGLETPTALVLHGGLFADRGLRDDLRRCLPRGRFALRPPAMPAELAAAVLPLGVKKASRKNSFRLAV